MNQTLSYYNTNAESFVEGTVNVDFSCTQNKFLKKLNERALILDFGCGSGRDTKCFLEKGYLVEAIDGSYELCQIAEKYTGIKVKNMGFLKESEMIDNMSQRHKKT